jgi:hypothetical protein
MLDRRLGLPLAFLLAMSSGDQAARKLAAMGSDEPLKRGSLRELLPADFTNSDSNITQGSNAASDGRLAQWFNFLNCFAGNWRRC